MRNVPIFVLLAVAAPAAADDAVWPQFRGPGARGISEETGLPDRWSREENVRWSRDVPGRGWSSPIVWGKRVFLTTAVSDGAEEGAKPGLYLGGDRSEPSPHRHRWLVLCLDAASGQVLWEHAAREEPPGTPRHIKNSHASETPVTDGQRVFAYFGSTGDLLACDLDGKRVWARNLGTYRMRSNWGTAASPVLHDDRLYVVNDNQERSFLVAVDCKTGDEVWRVERDEKSNWSTPFVWESEKRVELVTTGSGKVRSYDLSGKLLWELEGMSSITIPTPFAAHGLLYIASGFVLDRMKPVYAIRPGASGDISLEPAETASESIAWCDREAAPYNPSTLVYGDHFYTLFDRGFFACRDARTGKVLYDKKRIDRDIGAYTASPWAYEGKVFCLAEDGRTFVIKAGPDFEVVAMNDLDEMCMATPAIAGGKLYIRTLSKLYCIEK